MKYFINPYKKYHEKLSGLGNLTGEASAVASSIESAKSSISTLNSSINDSKWSEMGIDELKANVLPAILSNHETLADNINNSLVQIVNKAIGELLPVLTSLKEADEKLDKLNKELDTLLANPITEKDADGNERTTAAYQREVNEKKEEIEKTEKMCIELKNAADDCINEIKALDQAVSDFKVDISSITVSSSSNVATTVGQSVKDGKMIEIEFRGKKYYIANTKINALEYEKYLQETGAYQTNDAGLDGRCSTIACYYAVDMMRGTFTKRSVMADKDAKTGVCQRMGNGLATESEKEMLEYLYNELANGRMATLQVTQVNTVKTDKGYAGPRHVVTVIGFDESVKGPEDLNPDTILVLDCVDGKIQTLGQSRSEGGHERDLYQRDTGKGVRKYFAGGATDDFLSLEVENDEWYAKHGVKA